MKKFLPLIALFSIVFGYLSLLRIPYHFYQEAMSEGVNSRFLSLRKMSDKFYLGEEYRFFRMAGVTSDEKKLWEELHFNDFKVPFPIKHPSFLVSPLIYRENDHHRFGYKILNYDQEEINEVIFHPKIPFRLDLHKHLIFTLPVFERRILKDGMDQIWKDMFMKNLYGTPYLKTPGWFELYSPFQIPLSEMVYDLFILSLRERYLPQKIKNIQFWPKKRLGITEIISDESREGKPSKYLQETLFYPHGEFIYPIELRTLNEDFPAEKYRQRLLEVIDYKESNKDSSIPIYAYFQKLSYQEKFTPTGLTYLFAAFSHNKKSKHFLRQAIQFMERGKNDKIYLDPFYNYALELYGSNFSQILDQLEESQQEKLERLQALEKEKERARLEAEEINPGPDKFESKKDKVDFYLQKAKDEGAKPLEGDKNLILD